MKIIHTADWHLGNTFHSHDRSAEFSHFLSWLVLTIQEEQADALILTGDVFDNANPPASAEQMYYNFLLEATTAVPGLQIVVIAGNHDSASRLEAPSSLLLRHNVMVRGRVNRTEKDSADYAQLLVRLHSLSCDSDSLLCAAVPYLRQSDLAQGKTFQQSIKIFFKELMQKAKSAAGKHTPILLAAHLYGVGAELASSEHSERVIVGGQECVDAAEISDGADYVALGHIHKAQKVAGREHIRYCGSALPMSFTEKGYSHGVDCVVFSDDGVELNRIPYHPLCSLLSIPKTGAATPDEAIEMIEALPDKRKGDSVECYPYLEIKIKENAPEISLARRVVEALDGKAVRFCRIIREAGTEKTISDIDKKAETLGNITPLQMAQRIYSSHFSEEMPEKFKSLFAKAEEKAATDE